MRRKPLTHTLPNGTEIRVYDNGGASIDRYTVVLDGLAAPVRRGDPMTMLGLSPGGMAFSQFTEGQEGAHLGKRVAFDSLDPVTRRHIERRLG